MNENNNNQFNFGIVNMNMGTQTPSFKESSNKKWINFGNDNLYPQSSLDNYHNKSNKHKAIINKKAEMVAGNGFEEVLNPSIQYTNFINNAFGEKSLEEVALKLAYDQEIHSTFSLKIKWSRDGSIIAAVDYIGTEKVRLSTTDNSFYLSKDWENYRKADNEPFELSGFSQLNKLEVPIQIMYIKQDIPGFDYYNLPAYSSTIPYIMSDWEIGQFHYNSITNGFSGGFLINFATGVPTMEEMKDAQKKFIKKYTGTSGQKIVMTYSKGQDEAPTLQPITLDASDERFIMLNEMITSEIFIGHGVVSPMLFGVRTEGQLGGRDEMLEAMELFQTTYIDYQQRKIERVLNKLAKINGVIEEIKLKKYDLFKGDNSENKK